jgi:hypothetical protein
MCEYIEQSVKHDTIIISNLTNFMHSFIVVTLMQHFHTFMLFQILKNIQ